jgi:cardiolipin synthase A/B
MNDLWKSIGEIAASMHVDRIDAIAGAFEELHSVADFDKARPAFGPRVDPTRLNELKTLWSQSPKATPREVAAAFRSASQLAHSMRSSESVDLVWTGPKTGLIPTRNTEQVILEVIDSAATEVFVVSYVFYNATSIVESLNDAVERNVLVRILLETSTEHGGTVKGDGVKAMRKAVPGARIYVWDQDSKDPEFGSLSAAVHAKCAIADGNLAFITSANLTSAAMERNMELGVLIRGGSVPNRLQSHLAALATTKVIRETKQ